MVASSLTRIDHEIEAEHIGVGRHRLSPRRWSPRSRSLSSATWGHAFGAADTHPLFSFQEDEVTALTIQRQGETLAFEQGEAGWRMTQPQQQPAQESSVAFLLSQLTSGEAGQPVSVTPDNQADFGFTEPAATVELTLANGDRHTLLLGSADFSGSGFYALVDPPALPLSEDTEAETITAHIVSGEVASGINRPLDEWLMATDETPGAESVPSSAVPPAPLTPGSVPEDTADPAVE
ncbi:hypothetical protein XM38_002770 [Halomicronema hongdechloris C2206]|uniref:DUF4340 domain-containing protein n=1 Tax=Halomicronema hongdechloris C2206 TaxID=1641165 RepID=A0A1Z3HGC0_9CYAN|nr:DUF4340 domain-containing protein [Halomicronema hongdechloris]ASC69350.1 hypothetical protein XM38_002770 [Halomicronema hongdechloris C2206]